MGAKSSKGSPLTYATSFPAYPVYSHKMPDSKPRLALYNSIDTAANIGCPLTSKDATEEFVGIEKFAPNLS